MNNLESNCTSSSTVTVKELADSTHQQTDIKYLEQYKFENTDFSHYSETLRARKITTTCIKMLYKDLKKLTTDLQKYLAKHSDAANNTKEILDCVNNFQKNHLNFKNIKKNDLIGYLNNNNNNSKNFNPAIEILTQNLTGICHQIKANNLPKYNFITKILVNIKDILINFFIQIGFYLDSKKIYDLCQMIKKKDARKCEELIGKIHDLNRLSGDPLMVAIEQENTEIIELLLNNTSNANKLGENLDKILLVAIKNNNLNIVNMLIDYKANINLDEASGYNFLHLAIENNNTAMVTILLDKCVNFNIGSDKHQHSRYFLNLAVKNNNLDIVKILIEKGADVNAKDKRGKAPLHLATWKEKPDIINLLIREGANIDAKDIDGMTSLHMAISKENLDIIELLLNLGANIDAKDKKGIAPLHLATWKGKTDIIESLFKQGSNINIQERFGMTPLHVATLEGKTGPMKLLLNLGANIDAKDINGRTALYMAIFEERLDIIELLLNQGADVNATDKEGRTLLYLATSKINPNMVQLLLDKDAEIDTTDKGGCDVLGYALSIMASDILEVIVTHIGDINNKNKSGNTILHQALFLTKKSLNILKSNKTFPIQNIKVLLYNNIYLDILLKYYDINSAPDFHFQLQSFKYYKGIIKSIVNRGANQKIKNNEGKTIIDLASSLGIATIL